jgi:FKBP-type peptidyl-prolyl cis-trans isomerase 2
VTQITDGDTVQLHYTGKLSDGRVFDTSTDGEPFELTVGSNKVMPGFEQAVVGMSPGESKTVEIPMDQAYGPWRKDRVIVIDRDRFPEAMELKLGQRLKLRQKDGRPLPATVTGITEFSVRLDANHPLAGKDLVFDIEIIDIA